MFSPLCTKLVLCYCFVTMCGQLWWALWRLTLAAYSSANIVQAEHHCLQECIHEAAPSYLTNLCVPVATNTSRRYLRSATHGDLQVPRTRTVTYGPRSFAVSGPTIWNTLPSTLHVSPTTREQFQSWLKTMLFRLAYGTWLGAFVTV